MSLLLNFVPLRVSFPRVRTFFNTNFSLVNFLKITDFSLYCIHVRSFTYAETYKRISFGVLLYQRHLQRRSKQKRDWLQRNGCRNTEVITAWKAGDVKQPHEVFLWTFFVLDKNWELRRVRFKIVRKKLLCCSDWAKPKVTQLKFGSLSKHLLRRLERKKKHLNAKLVVPSINWVCFYYTKVAFFFLFESLSEFRGCTSFYSKINMRYENVRYYQVYCVQKIIVAGQDWDSRLLQIFRSGFAFIISINKDM